MSDLERSQVALHANGKIRWWNFKLGRLIDTHNARHKTDALLTTGTTDTTNSFMVTADSLGYLKVWDISQYSEATGQQTHFIQLYVCERRATAVALWAVCHTASFARFLREVHGRGLALWV